MTRLVTEIKPHQLVLSKTGNSKVGFFDRLYKVDVVKDSNGKEISSKMEPRLYIHIEFPHDPSTVVERPAKEVKIQIGDDFQTTHEKDLYVNAYNVYLSEKEKSGNDPYEEIERLKKQLAEKESFQPAKKVISTKKTIDESPE